MEESNKDPLSKLFEQTFRDLVEHGDCAVRTSVTKDGEVEIERVDPQHIVYGEGIRSQILHGNMVYYDPNQYKEKALIEQKKIQLEMLQEDLLAQMTISKRSKLKSKIRGIQRDIRRLSKRLL